MWNKRRSRTVMFSVNGALKRTIERTTSHFYKETQYLPKHLDRDLVGRSQAGSFRGVRFWKSIKWESWRILIGPFRIISPRTFQFKGHNQRLLHLGIIQEYIIVPSDLERRIEICSFRQGLVVIVRFLNTNSNFVTFFHQNSNFDVKDKIHAFRKQIVHLKKNYRLTPWWKHEAGTVGELWV